MGGRHPSRSGVRPTPRYTRPPLVPEVNTAQIRARAERLAPVLEETFSQEELRLLSWAVYRSACRGTMPPRRIAVLRPILTALALAIREHEELPG